MAKPRYLLAVVALLLSGSAFAEVYRYIDADGNVAFTDQPPAKAAAEEIQLASYAASSTRTPVGRVQREGLSDEVLVQADTRRIARVAREQAADRHRRCAEARTAIGVLQQAMPVYRDWAGEFHVASSGNRDDGPQVFLSDVQRQSALASQNRKLAMNCGAPDVATGRN